MDIYSRLADTTTRYNTGKPDAGRYVTGTWTKETKEAGIESEKEQTKQLPSPPYSSCF